MPCMSAGKAIACPPDGGGRGQMWAVLYDDGTSLTTASEPIAHSLAEAERQRGHRVTVRFLDAAADSVPENQPRCPNRAANPSRPVRPGLRDAADSWSTRSPPPASSSRPHWPITG